MNSPKPEKKTLEVFCLETVRVKRKVVFEVKENKRGYFRCTCPLCGYRDRPLMPVTVCAGSEPVCYTCAKEHAPDFLEFCEAESDRESMEYALDNIGESIAHMEEELAGNDAEMPF